MGQKWIDALTSNSPQYRELTLEFPSTFRYDYQQFDEVGLVSFALGRQMYELAVPQFTVAAGFYTREEVRDLEFARMLRGYYQKPHSHGVRETHLRHVWDEISGGETVFG